MTSTPTRTTSPQKPDGVSHKEMRRITAARNRRQTRLKYVLAGVVVVVLVLAVLAGKGLGGGSSAGTKASGSGDFPYQVGKPGPGEAAPDFKLPSADGTTFDLASLRGKTVLLFFQEGVMCEPCWTQIQDIEKAMGRFQTAGIDTLVSITTDPVDVVRQKVRDEGIKSVNLADKGARVSKEYSATDFGMPGHVDTNGHSFVLVKDGRVLARSDYGGAPNYSMYVPVDRLLADMAKRS